jgi:hypothetical protein
MRMRLSKTIGLSCFVSIATITCVKGLSTVSFDPSQNQRIVLSSTSPPPSSCAPPLEDTDSVRSTASDPSSSQQDDHHHPTTLTRRAALRKQGVCCFGAFCGWILEPKARRSASHFAFADVLVHHNEATAQFCDSVPFFVQGTVTLPADYTAETEPGQMTALYVTCRPNRADNVPKAILDGSRGKAPPVLTARFENPKFPFCFHLTKEDVTLEGQQQQQRSDDNDSYWWQEEDLIVSARLDMDGIAATRAPDDLVGRGFFQRNKAGEAVQIALTGRGAFGKFATGGGSRK